MDFVERGDITELITTRQFEEAVELEAKRAGGAIPGSAWESISAFANTVGGILVLGLDESEDDWRVEGVADPDKMVQDLHNAVRNRNKISYEAAGNGDIWKEEIDGRQLVIVRIHAAPRRYKPVFLNGNRDMAYVRRNEGDMRCTQDELDRMRREAGPSTFDSQMIPFLELSDFDHDTIARYRRMSEEARPNLAHHRLALLSYLTSIGAWRIDRERGIEGPTYAGMLMFGTDTAIHEIRTNHLIDYRRVPVDHTPTRRWTDRIQWSGNLFDAWEQIFPRLSRGLPTPFRLRGPQRVDQPAGLDALREAFVNLLVHTDYQEPSDAVILHRDDGYTFRNPGQSWVDLRDLGVQGRSDRRNPEIARMFNHIGLADRAGSGFIRILDEWRELGYQNPNVASDPTRYEFELDLKLAALPSTEDRKWLEIIGGPWREEEEMALIFAYHVGYVDNQSLRFATGQHLFDASKTLQSLRNRDLLILQGSGRNSSYVLGPATTASTDHIPRSSDHSDGSSDHWAPNSDHSDGSSDHWAPNSDHLSNTNKRILDDQIEAISEPISLRERVNGAEMKHVILRICSVRSLSSEELAGFLNRKPITIRRYTTALLAEGKLVPLFDALNHPRQQYRTHPGCAASYPQSQIRPSAEGGEE